MNTGNAHRGLQAAVVAAEVTRRISLISLLPSASLPRRLRVATDVRRWIFLLTLFLLTPLAARAQGFTNSATLDAAVVGTNLVVSYSLTTTQGWVTLFAADRPELLVTNARPVDLAPVPPGRQGQFTVPLDPAAPAQFYKLLIEQWPSRGKALVFVDGPHDFAAMRQTYGDLTNVVHDPNCYPNCPNFPPVIFKQPVEVWLDNLGNYDTNGVLVGSNAGILTGKYSEPSVFSIYIPVAGYLLIGLLVSSNNDFRVNYAGDTNVPIREAVIWSAEVQMYYDVNQYRKNFLNDAFIDELDLPPEIAANLKQRQFRPDLDNLNQPTRRGKPILVAYESNGVSSIELIQYLNQMDVTVRTRGPGYYATQPPWSAAYDSGVCVGDYAGLIAAWVLGTNKGFPPDAFYGGDSGWQSNVLSPISNGLSAWTSYRFTGNPEVYRNDTYMRRIWGDRLCGGTGIPCDKGSNIRNVMMFDEANTTKDGVFPYTHPAGVSNLDGPVASDLAALFFGGVLYDIAHETGLGLHKTDLLIWKTISLADNFTNFPMRVFGAKVQAAARALWPDARLGRAGLSLYEEDLVDVLTSRGIPLNGVADFRTNLPVAIGKFPETLEVSSANGFGSSHPESQPGVGFYGNYSTFVNRYTDTNTSASYVAYQFYKHSKYGPCDKLALTDGTFTANTSAPFNWSYNSNGTFYVELTDRELGNLVLFAPSNHIRWMRSRQRCPNEATGFYAEDVRPFGFRVIQATANGFSFTASALTETGTNKTYQLTIVDPSTNTLGAATYAWTVTNYLGTASSQAGATAQITVEKDQPFTLRIARTRASKTDTLTLRERGNDLDRNSGNAFVRNLVP